MKPHGLRYVKYSSIGLLLAAAAVSSPARAEQFVLLDLTYEATAQNTMDSHFPAKPAMETPKNLKTPINYAGGTAYVRFEVLAKPSAAKTLYNICFENPSNYACMPYPDAYTATGVYNFNYPFSAFWQYDVVDWSMGITGVQLIIKDEKETKVQGNAMFYPYKMHVTITLVAPGSTYVPPDITSSGGAAGTPAAAGSSAAGMSGAAGMAAAGRGGAGAGASGRAGGSAGRAGAGAAGQAGAADDPGSDDPSGAAGSIGAAGRDATGSDTSSSTSGNEAGSAASPATGAPVDTSEVDPSAPITRMNPGLGEIEQPNKRAPPPGNIEAGCSTVVTRGGFEDARALTALGILLAGLGGYRVQRRRRRAQGMA